MSRLAELVRRRATVYRLMLLGRAAPVVNARLPLTEACAHGLRGLWPQAEDVTDNAAIV